MFKNNLKAFTSFGHFRKKGGNWHIRGFRSGFSVLDGSGGIAKNFGQCFRLPKCLVNCPLALDDEWLSLKGNAKKNLKDINMIRVNIFLKEENVYTNQVL